MQKISRPILDLKQVFIVPANGPEAFQENYTEDSHFGDKIGVPAVTITLPDSLIQSILAKAFRGELIYCS